MKYHNITKCDMLNGDGIRVVLWVAGCNHHCKGCQNPMTWNPDDGVDFTQEAKDEIFAELEKEEISGITFSGGDPLHPANAKTLVELAKEIKTLFSDKTIWTYSGSAWGDDLNCDQAELISLSDVMVDGEYVEKLRDVSLAWKGSSNQRVIDVQATLANDGCIVLHCDDKGDNI